MQVLTTWDPSTWKTDHLMFSVACRSLRISGYRALSLWPWKMAWFCIIHLPKIWRFMAKSHPYFLCCIIFLCQIAKYLTPISALWDVTRFILILIFVLFNFSFFTQCDQRKFQVGSNDFFCILCWERRLVPWYLKQWM